MNIETIKRITSIKLNVSIDDINGRGKHKKVITARQIAIYLTRKHTKETVMKIGRSFNKHHSNISSNFKSVSGYIETDKTFALQVEEVEKALNAI
jgi:chromosomal replication initiator protein